MKRVATRMSPSWPRSGDGPAAWQRGPCPFRTGLYFRQMPPTAVPELSISADLREGNAPTPSCARQRRLGLSWLGELHAAAFVASDDDTAHLLEVIKDAATALALEGAAARERLLARHTALAAATVDLLVAAAGARAQAGDAAGALLADRLATGATRRLALLLGAAEKRGAAVAIQNAIVNVEAAR